MSAPLTDVVVLRPRSGAVVVECRGEHDLTTKGELGALLAELVAENDVVVVDVSAAVFVDSSFLHNLVEARRLAVATGTSLRLFRGTAPVVRSALEHSGIISIFDEASARDEAPALLIPATVE